MGIHPGCTRPRRGARPCPTRRAAGAGQYADSPRSSLASSASGYAPVPAPVSQRAGDIAAILTTLQPRHVLFVDEIHRLQPAIEEILYPALEDFQLDLIIGEGPAARSSASTCRPSPSSARRPAPALTTPLARPLRYPPAARLLHARGLTGISSAEVRRSWASLWTRTAPRRLPGAPAVPRAWPGGSSAGCGILPPSLGSKVVDRQTAR